MYKTSLEHLIVPERKEGTNHTRAHTHTHTHNDGGMPKDIEAD